MTDTSNLFYISVEMVYGEGVGNYYMITDKISNIYLLRNKLYKCAKSIKLSGSYDSCEWEFHEYIYKICDMCVNATINCSLINLYSNVYDFDTKLKKLNINWHQVTKKSFESESKSKSDFENITLYNVIELDIVYNTISEDIKPVSIEFFDFVKN